VIDPVCRSFVRALDLTHIVETGLDVSETVAEVSRWMADLDPGFGIIQGDHVPGVRGLNPWNEPIRYPVFAPGGASDRRVVSVDIDEESVLRGRELFASNPNIQIFQDDSAAFLERWIASVRGTDRDRILFFLDAHWGPRLPLRDELGAILHLDRAIVVIDDFFVPGRSDASRPDGEFGFDVYRGLVLCWGYIADLFECRRVRVFYPTRPNRDRRGWVLIALGYTGEELDGVDLEGLPLFEVDSSDPDHLEVTRPSLRAILSPRTLIKSFVPARWIRRLIRYVRGRPARPRSRSDSPGHDER
jgi:hypothetical protein